MSITHTYATTDAAERRKNIAAAHRRCLQKLAPARAASPKPRKK